LERGRGSMGVRTREGNRDLSMIRVRYIHM
jgi:hypothetical protein